ncbi:DUF6461 domain-containing protein [Nonomuraea salmonea]|uniref:DUF6461 domain-containing protein n=1 Tax=Nonomuraea salmonea TaxID=46181 RepID=UPI003CD08859
MAGRGRASASSPPDVRAGREPDALNAHMEGLALGAGNDSDTISDAAFALIGRMTGRPLSADWLRAEHTRYVLPMGAWNG